MEGQMHQIIRKTIKKDKPINSLLKKETFAQIFVKFKKIMGQGSFLENLNEWNLFLRHLRLDLTSIFSIQNISINKLQLIFET